MAATENQAPRMSLWKRALFSEYLVLYLSIAYFLALAPFTPGFASQGNLANILSNLLPMAVLAIGQTLVLISGGIDLSVTSILALASVTGATVMSQDAGWMPGHFLALPAGLCVMLLVGLGIGLINGLAITRFNMPPFIVTLTTMMFCSGLAVWFTQSKTVAALPATFNAIGKETWIAAMVAILVGAVAHILLSHHLFGRWLYAAGHNPKAAFISGVPVKTVIIAAYMLSGLCAAVASILYTGRQETGSPILGQRVLLDVIGAAVIGGNSLFGGKGKILWAVWGVLFITLIDNSLNLLNLSHFSIMMVKGSVILMAAWIDSLRKQLAERS